MMISPEGYKRMHQDLSLEELVKERQKLISSLCEFENAHILGNKEIVSIMKPSPETYYELTVFGETNQN